MALNILLILAILANLKCIFLSAKIIISDCRNRFKIFTIKALKYLKL